MPKNQLSSKETKLLADWIDTTVLVDLMAEALQERNFPCSVVNIKEVWLTVLETMADEISESIDWLACRVNGNFE